MSLLVAFSLPSQLFLGRHFRFHIYCVFTTAFWGQHNFFKAGLLWIRYPKQVNALPVFTLHKLTFEHFICKSVVITCKGIYIYILKAKMLTTLSVSQWVKYSDQASFNESPLGITFILSAFFLGHCSISCKPFSYSVH